MFNLPMINPENVSRDFIDVFGGYNHNLRIGDNEFYDMKNMSSSFYPLLATREKRGNVPIDFVPSVSGSVCGIAYKSAFYSVAYSVVSAGYPLRVYKNGQFIAGFGVSDRIVSEPIPRKIIMMGAYMIIMPDKVYVNTEDVSDCGMIEAEVSTENDMVTVNPCLDDGKVIDISCVGSTAPEGCPDGYGWVDTSANTPSFKRYDAKNDTWIPVVFQSIRFTAAGTDIAENFSEGDGIDISGVPTEINGTEVDFNGTAILRKKPDDKSMVISNVFPNTSLKVFKAVEDQPFSDSVKKYYVRVLCDKSVTKDQFVGKTFVIGNKKAVCTSNSASKEYEYWVRRDLHVSSFQANYFTVKQRVNWNSSLVWNKIKVEQRTNGSIQESFYDSKESLDDVYVSIGNDTSNRNVYKYRHHSTGDDTLTENADEISLCGYDGNNPDISRIPAGTKIYPIEKGDSHGLYETTIAFHAQPVYEKEEHICLDPGLSFDITTPITISRKMPKMDFVIENQNRLWGCRYGTNNDGNPVNEIYSSKLGDFKNWRCFEGVSTDSYIASCGTDGAWTGAISFMSKPIFFKENYFHTVYGSYPAQYQINSVAARGVQQGSDKSLAILNETLYYLSPEGVCTYDGSLPVNISSAFGDIRYYDAVACTYKGKYYISMIDKNQTPVFMAYDAKRGLWHKEDDLKTIDLCPVDDDVYYIDDNRAFGSLFGTGGKDADPVKWFVETGIYGLSQIDSKYISRVNLRMALEKGSSAILSIQYDNSGVWQKMCTVMRHNINPFTLPIKPRRCDHFRLRLEGTGGAKIYSISKTIEQGSDIV